MNKAVIKWLLIFSALLFADWVLMILLGCLSGICQVDERFYCSVYCVIGKVLLASTAGLVIYLLIKFISKKIK